MATNIKVIARFRPVASNFGSETESCAFHVNQQTNSVTIRSQEGDKIYSFDSILPSSSSQQSVFDKVDSLIPTSLEGYNLTIMTYGQTSSGKTFTMEGLSLTSSEMQGIIPRTAFKLFDCINHSSNRIAFTVKVSYFEIYCEKVRDLLKPSSTNLRLHEDKHGGVFIGDITEIFVSSPQDIIKVIERGKSFRASAPTLMNAESSRSHSIISIELQSVDDASQTKRSGKIMLIDLAGSEKISKTGAVGMRLEEAKKINTSLTCLGRVISALSKRERGHIPYRDSKLTRILTQSLGGNSQTVLIICCAPEEVHAEETISTLRFGERAKKVVNLTKCNEELGADVLKSFLLESFQEIVDLRKDGRLPIPKNSILRYSDRIGFTFVKLPTAVSEPSVVEFNDADDAGEDGESLALSTQFSEEADDDEDDATIDNVEALDEEKIDLSSLSPRSEDSPCKEIMTTAGSGESIARIEFLTNQLESAKSQVLMEQLKRGQIEENLISLQNELDSMIRLKSQRVVSADKQAEIIFVLQSDAVKREEEILQLTQAKEDAEKYYESLTVQNDDTIQCLIERMTEEQEKILLIDSELRVMGSSVGDLLIKAKKGRDKRGKSLSPSKIKLRIGSDDETMMIMNDSSVKRVPKNNSFMSSIVGKWFDNEETRESIISNNNDDEEDDDDINEMLRHQVKELQDLRQVCNSQEATIHGLQVELLDQQEAIEVVMKAKESVVKSLVSQNNSLLVERNELSLEAIRLKKKVVSLTSMLMTQSAATGNPDMVFNSFRHEPNAGHSIRGGAKR